MKRQLDGLAELALRKLHLWPPRLRIAEHRRGFKDELRVLWRELSAPGPDTARRFVVYGTGRSGSSLLVTLLDGNPAVKCAGELLRPWHVAPHSYLVRHARQSQTLAWGFKLLDYHVAEVHHRDRARFLRRLHRDGFSIIYLERERHFPQAISHMVASMRDVWWQRHDAEAREIVPLHFDLTVLADHLDRLDRQR